QPRPAPARASERAAAGSAHGRHAARRRAEGERRSPHRRARALALRARSAPARDVGPAARARRVTRPTALALSCFIIIVAGVASTSSRAQDAKDEGGERARLERKLAETVERDDVRAARRALYELHLRHAHELGSLDAWKRAEELLAGELAAWKPKTAESPVAA